ncbi:hypothetical protein KI387_009985 [Taxus chinensis]|uniref:FYVE-type domain-containing protein n=1 Tax=Taxus chinensis TaxID=29808 RepID=A0AA38FKK9_TAXCH|nr:hypothetical protein KI387_009985 [Taxus chinensis]
MQVRLDLPFCPLCRTPFGSNMNLRLNIDLNDALERMKTMACVERYEGSQVNSLSESDGGLTFLEETDPWIQVSVSQKGHTECLSSVEHVSYHANSDINRGPQEIKSETPRPEVNMRNVLSGLYTIVTGRNLSDPHQEEPPEATSELASEEFVQTVTALWPEANLPSAPPLMHVDEGDNHSIQTILEAEPPQWVPDSVASCCMHCESPFKLLVCRRHHCRFCGGIFCSACSIGKCLLPIKFRERNPQRVCDICYEKLEPLQGFLMKYVSNASQIATHDVIDWTCLRGWLNTPLGLSMEQEIYKSSNVLRNYCQIARLKGEGSIPVSVLQGAKGLAILTVVKAGMVLTYKLGTGLVIARRENGSWSAPSAILSFGLGWGVQVGAELTDFVILLRNSAAVKAFSSRMHFSLGGGLSAAAGPLGRVVEADFRAGDQGIAACYTYSCSKGAFVGLSLEGNIVALRTERNTQFYGDPYLTPTDILLGPVESPRAAKPLYSALHDLFESLEG